MEKKRGLVLQGVDGRTCPVVICESCGEVIRDYGAAWVTWPEIPSDGQRHQPLVVCKTNHCVSKKPYVDYPSMELRDYLINLCRNLGMRSDNDFHEALEFAELSDMI
jgi:hypothetical protein